MARPTVHSGVDSGGAGPGIRAGLSAIYDALLLVRGIRIVLPLLLYFLFEIAVILLYARSGPGALDGFWGLFLPGRGSAAVRHYPYRLLMLPVILGRLDIALDIVLYSIVQGTTVLLVASALSGGPLRLAGSFGLAMKRYRHIAGVMLVATVALFCATYLPSVPALLGWTAHNRRLAAAGGIALGILAQAFFLYAVPFVLLNGKPLLGAVGGSFRLARRRYPLSLTLAAIPFIITLPTFLLGFKAQFISLRTFPELIMHIQILGEIMKLISGYILIGGVTVAFLRENPGASGREGDDTTREEEGDR